MNKTAGRKRVRKVDVDLGTALERSLGHSVMTDRLPVRVEHVHGFIQVEALHRGLAESRDYLDPLIGHAVWLLEHVLTSGPQRPVDAYYYGNAEEIRKKVMDEARAAGFANPEADGRLDALARFMTIVVTEDRRGYRRGEPDSRAIV
jgi:hypothetical protein